MKEIEGKGIVEWITQQINNILNLQVLKPLFNKVVNEEYSKGLEKSELQFEMNFVPQQENLATLNETMMDNIEQQGMEITHSVKGELQRWKLNNENLKQAKSRIKQAMMNKKWNYKVKRVIRTESLRANNWGALDGAKQSGLSMKKYLDIILDDVTSPICKAGDRKYGTKDKGIPLDKEFIVKVDNKTYKAQAPPFHPNCRTVVRFVRDDE